MKVLKEILAIFVIALCVSLVIYYINEDNHKPVQYTFNITYDSKVNDADGLLPDGIKEDLVIKNTITTCMAFTKNQASKEKLEANKSKYINEFKKSESVTNVSLSVSEGCPPSIIRKPSVVSSTS